jgi:hypothetical protein
MSNGTSNNSTDQYFAPWPTPYRADTDACLASEPRLQRQLIMQIAPTVASWFLDDDQTFGQGYRELARLYRSAQNRNLIDQYLALLTDRAGKQLASDWRLYVANEHDFANLHRAVWLLMLQALSRVLDFNLHGDWGDPPAGGTSQGRYDDASGRTYFDKTYRVYPENFHTTPNAYGSYAISTLDLPAPDLGVGEESGSPTPNPGSGTPLSTDQIKLISRALGRGIVNRQSDKNRADGDDYLRIVKDYYRDGINHTQRYVAVIQQILSDSQSSVTLPAALSDDDVANVHRGAWLFLAHRFSYVVGKNPFGSYGDVDQATCCVDLPGEPPGVGPRRFEFPNQDGEFYVNLAQIDPEDP